METHSSTLAWRIPGKAEPAGLPSVGSNRVGHDYSDLAAAEALAAVMPNSLQPRGLYSPSGSSIHVILQARTLEWVAIPFSRSSSQPGVKPQSPTLQAGSLPSEETTTDIYIALPHQGSAGEKPKQRRAVFKHLLKVMVKQPATWHLHRNSATWLRFSHTQKPRLGPLVAEGEKCSLASPLFSTSSAYNQ